MKMILKTILAATAAGTLAQGAGIFSDSLSLGGADIPNFQDTSPYSSGTSTTVTTWNYDADGGLTHAGIDNESGGAAVSAIDDNRNFSNTSLSFDQYATMSAGDELWFSGLIGYAGGSATIYFDSSQSVNRIGMGIVGGNVRLDVSDDGGGTLGNTTTQIPNWIDSGADATTGSTYLLLTRVTFGAGNSNNRNSTIDFWFNPSDTSSVANLGTATFSTGADSKIGRLSGAYTGYTNWSLGAEGNAFDEIRVADSLSSLVAIPEPGTFAMMGLAGIAALFGLRRRKR